MNLAVDPSPSGASGGLSVPSPIMARRLAKANGYIIIEADLAPCLLPLSDWHPDSFLARHDREFVIFLMRANLPGHGAWRRLLANLRRIKGASIAVDHPTGRFRDHLIHHSWKPVNRGDLELWLDPLRGNAP